MALVKVVKQRFDGYVTDIQGARISARIIDDGYIVLRGNLVRGKQLRNIYKGAEFDIEIGILYGPKHFNEPFFRFNLHRQSLWTQMQIDECKRQAEELCEKLGCE